MEKVSMEQCVNYVCKIAEKNVKNNPNNNTRVIDGLAEVLINGVMYQAQVILEPNRDDWVPEGIPTIRTTEVMDDDY